MVHEQVQLPPAPPEAVLHSLLRSHEQEFGVTTRPEAPTVPTHVLVQAELPSEQLAPLLSLQKVASIVVVIVSSRHSLGRTQRVCVPLAGPLMA